MRNFSTLSGHLTPFLKPLALAGCFAFQLSDIADRFASVTAASGQAIYVGLLCICWAGIVGAAFTRNVLLRWSWALLLTFAGGMMAVFMHASQQFMTYDAYINMVNSAAFAGDAWDQNRLAFLAAMPPAGLMLIGVGLSPRPRKSLIGKIGWVFPFASLTIITAMLFMRGGDGGRGLPGGMVVSAYGALFGYELATGDVGERADVTIAVKQPPAFRTIVLIVDESIAPAYLDINSSAGVATPLSRDHASVSVHNFGIAAAITG